MLDFSNYNAQLTTTAFQMTQATILNNKIYQFTFGSVRNQKQGSPTRVSITYFKYFYKCTASRQVRELESLSDVDHY